MRRKNLFGFLSILISLALFGAKLSQAQDLYRIVQDLELALSAWNLSEAEGLLKTLPIDSQDPIYRFYQGKIAFYKGDYESVLSLYEPLNDLPEAFMEFVAYCKQASEIAKNFAQEESEHFIFRYAKGKDAILPVLGLPVLESALSEIGRDLQFVLAPNEKIRVEVYPSSEAFIAVSSLTRKEIETSGTIAICKFNRLMISSPRVLARGYGWQDALSHELTHYILVRKTKNKTPVWLQEGIAKFEERRWRTPKGGEISPALQSLLAQALKQNYFVPFESMHPSFAKLKSQEDGQLAFGQVVMIVSAFFDQGGYGLINAILNRIETGLDAIDAISQSGIVIDNLLELSKSSIRKKGFSVISGLNLLPTRLRDGNEMNADEEDDLSDIETSAVRKMAKLGDLLRDRNHVKAAIVEYEKALELSIQKSPVLTNKLALAHKLNGNLEEAEALLRASLTRYPDFATTLVRLGEILLEKGENEEAITIFTQALGINPFHPLIHKSLYELYERSGDSKRSRLHLDLLKMLVDGRR